jgi:hypothetical protein
MVLRPKRKKMTLKAVDPPKLTDQQWNVLGLAGIIFFAMAILQLASFNDFKAWLDSIHLGQPQIWAVGLILAELWASVGFFKVRLSPLFRMVSATLALLVSGFWFLQNIRLVSDGASGVLQSSGFFGRFLTQTPSWWTVLEAGLFFFLVLHCLSLVKDDLTKDLKK